MTSRKKKFPDIIEQKHLETHRDCKHEKDLPKLTPDKIPATRGWGGVESHP